MQTSVRPGSASSSFLREARPCGRAAVSTGTLRTGGKLERERPGRIGSPTHVGMRDCPIWEERERRLPPPAAPPHSVNLLYGVSFAWVDGVGAELVLRLTGFRVSV